jgi:glycosyltransferase involved in cell wall biosynthesis
LNKFSNRTNKKIVLNVVGEGPLLQNLKPKTWSFEVNYLGSKPPDEVAGILQNSDYFLHASEIETFSIVIAEALSTGTPVLASNVGAISELVNSKNGVLTSNTIDAWVKGLDELCGTEYDHAQIAESTQKFSEKNIGAQFTRLYESVVKNGSMSLIVGGRIGGHLR